MQSSKKVIGFLILSLVAQLSIGQDKPTNTEDIYNDSTYVSSFWISGNIGAGGAISSNIINSGAVFPVRNEYLWQNEKKRRLGFGISHELLITPEELGRMALGKSDGSLTKLYFIYEKHLLRDSPINWGFSGNIGFFGAGGGYATDSTTQDKDSRGGMFANVGFVSELGIRPFYLYVKPDIEYQSWGSFQKHIQVVVNVGVRLKLLTEAERDRRKRKKTDKKNKKSNRKYNRKNKE